MMKNIENQKAIEAMDKPKINKVKCGRCGQENGMYMYSGAEWGSVECPGCNQITFYVPQGVAGEFKRYTSDAKMYIDNPRLMEF